MWFGVALVVALYTVVVGGAYSALCGLFEEQADEWRCVLAAVLWPFTLCFFVGVGLYVLVSGKS